LQAINTGNFMLSEEISQLASLGRSCFSFEDLEQRIDSDPTALKAALRRLLKKGHIARPLRGFYVIVPPEYRSLGCLPAEQFIPELMSHLGELYYAGLLSAAAYHGAAHHRPQVFQVVVTKPRRSIHCGKVKIDFVVRKNAPELPTQSRNTPTGVIELSTPEATAFDLVGYSQQCGGLDNVATILAELSEKLDSNKLVKIAESSPISWSQRLGYLLSVVDAEAVNEGLAQYVKARKPVRTPLLPSVNIKGARTDNLWKVFVNMDVEPEI
jgi:predicted transcriptional regulator of viral defense system